MSGLFTDLPKDPTLYKEELKRRVAEQLKVEAIESENSIIEATSNITYDIDRAFDNSVFVPARFVNELLMMIGRSHIVTPASTIDKDVTYWYNDKTGIFKPTGSAWIRKLVHRLLGEASKNGRVSEVVGAFQRETLDFSETFHDETPDFILTENGALNVKTSILHPFTPKIRSFSRLPVKYDPEAKCPNFIKFLSEILEQPYVDGVQEWFGYCLYKKHPIRKAFMGLGAGANGKSTLLEILGSLLGFENTTSVPISELDEAPFSIAELFSRMANIVGDLPPDTLKVTAMFTAITGMDRIKAQRKFGQPFYFTNYSKQIFTMNRLPSTYNDSKAFFDRVYLVPFTKTFEGPNRIPREQIIALLTNPTELSGILNFALDGLDRLLKNGEFTGSISADEMAKYYALLSDPVEAWVENCTISDVNGEVEKSVAYKSFQEFCTVKKYIPVSQTKFKHLLKKAVPEVSDKKVTIMNERKWVWLGFTLKEDPNPQQKLEVSTVSTVSTVSQSLKNFRTKVVESSTTVDTTDTLDSLSLKGSLQSRIQAILKVIQNNIECSVDYIAGEIHLSSEETNKIILMMVREKLLIQRGDCWRLA